MKNIKSAVLFCLFIVASFGSTLVHADKYVAGKHYLKIFPEQPTISGDTVEIVEVFSYICPHCHRFQPHVEKWLKTHKPKGVKFVRMPAIFRDSWAIYARAYYTAEALGVVNQIHTPLFQAIHAHKRRLGSEPAMMQFFADNGVNNKDFKKTFNSFSVDSKVRRSRELSRRYKVQSTPSIVVSGKYVVDPGHASGNFDEMLNIVDFLLKKG